MNAATKSAAVVGFFLAEADVAGRVAAGFEATVDLATGSGAALVDDPLVALPLHAVSATNALLKTQTFFILGTYREDVLEASWRIRLSPADGWLR